MAYLMKREGNGQEENSMDDAMEEIYEVVYAKVMRDVQQNLKDMKPFIEQSIVEMAVSAMDRKYENKISRLENKINKLENKITNLKSEKSNVNQSDRRFLAEGAGVKDICDNKANNTDKIDLKACIGVYRFVYDGWIYYSNRQMGNFLYKVRKDGRENTQLTDYSVTGNFKVSNGYLSFMDADYRYRKIKLD